MGKDYIHRIPRQVKDAELASDSIDHTAIADSFIKTDSGDPAASNDTGEGYVVGSLWVNTTSGQQFICTDITAEDATWINQEGDDINPPTPHQGSTKGFMMGGIDHPGASVDHIQTTPFASDTNSSDFGEFAHLGGRDFIGTAVPTAKDYQWAFGGGPSEVDVIERFGNSTPYSGTDWGNLTEARQYHQSAADGTSRGISMGGRNSGDTHKSDIETFSFSSPGNATDSTSELTQVLSGGASAEDNTYATILNGWYAPATVNTMNRFTKASITDATDWGEAATTRAWSHGCNDTTYGYSVGGSPDPAGNIERTSFSSAGGSTDVGELGLVTNNQGTHGMSSTTHGYAFGGDTPATPTGDNHIRKFAFSSPASGTDVGEMTVSNAPSDGKLYGVVGSQH